ncbi:rRNA pseudouridine synthase [Desulfobotulus sp. H1]|uniref:Pseudouridine synthase n=1 Tax=Desulfobotulus pelophilus TaxID=2823377 RepID=A0ABT3N777_9BACT|nr:pseudouridine synthase [Desulfobotulus pelophilus]MCW7753312.1 rRNA pseudouridine synthase [Desulfobotulus pelophilus]
MQTTAPEKDPPAQGGTRLQKFLADAGVCSRREAERRIHAGRVEVNGRVVREMGTRVDPGDSVRMDGRAVGGGERMTYIILNKPAGVVSSCKHPGEKVVTDLVKLPQRIFPVGRLDKDSTGLVLLTNDGPLHHCLSHPSFDHEKEYVVHTTPVLSDRALALMAKGIIIEGKKTRPARVFREKQNGFRIILKEGRNRQIRKMVAACDAKVLQLHRIRLAFLELQHLMPGEWRHLTSSEVKQLLSLQLPVRAS